MKKIYIILLTTIFLSVFTQNTLAQFIVAQDTIRGRVDFCLRPGDFNNSIAVPNDSVFYMLPPDKEIDPWRYVSFYTPSRSIERGYIHGAHLMRIDDYDIVEVERLSSHGSISFKNEDVRVQITTANISDKDRFIKHLDSGEYSVNGRIAKGVTRWASPKVRYQSISVSIKGKHIYFPKKVYEYFLNPDIENMVVYYNPNKETVYINTNNGEPYAQYNVLWVVSPKGVVNPYVLDK